MQNETSTTSGPYFAPGSPSTHANGVLYQGDFQHPADGSAAAVRLHARALAAQGVPVLLRAISATVLAESGAAEPLFAGLPKTVHDEIWDLTQTSISKLNPSIRHLIIHKPEDLRRLLLRGTTSPLDSVENQMVARKVVYGSSVVYSVWERDRIDSQMSKELSSVLENWVPCEQNADMLRACGVQNVFVVPHPFDPAGVLPKFTQRQVRAYKGVDLRKRRFYSIGRWEPRKNQHGLLRAFCAAFHPDDDVSLTLKWHGFWRDYAPFEVVISQLEEQFPIWRGRTRERITTHPSHLPADQILRLHFENNIYLAPSCGEAWCLPAFEAKVAGNRLIHTPYGGTRDFAGDADFDLPFELEAVPASYGWPEGSQWARPDHDALVAALRAAQVPERFERSADFEARFNLQAVGRRMRTRLQELTGAPWL